MSACGADRENLFRGVTKKSAPRTRHQLRLPQLITPAPHVGQAPRLTTATR